MRQARTVLSTYSADVFGVCSALYELGGMIVMHDASGCNSTYSTHDEPRWYRSDSLVFISGLTETDAILGNDEKLKNDMLAAIRQLRPAFAAVAGTPIPMMTGFDYAAFAAGLEREAGIPCFGFSTNGMRSYLCGASEALAAVAERLTRTDVKKRRRTVNILGATPLDFSLGGTVPSVRRLLAENGWEVVGCWAMDSDPDAIARAGEAEVNLVVSGVGMKAADTLKRKFGTPRVVGLPVGAELTEKLLLSLSEAADGKPFEAFFGGAEPPSDDRFVIIGESVISRSLAASVRQKHGSTPRVLCPLEPLPELNGVLSASDLFADGEEEIRQACRNAETVIADPLYRPVLPSDCRFIELPHEAFSGRMFRKRIPDLTRFSV